jgi:hypothetical protein
VKRILLTAALLSLRTPLTSEARRSIVPNREATVPRFIMSVRDPLPYGKRARRALRGGRHG